MKRTNTVLSVGILAFAVTHLDAEDKMAASAATGSGASAAQPPASAGLLNDWLREQSGDFKSWDLGGQFRVRYEAKDNFGVTPATDFRAAGVNNDNEYLLLRERFHVGYTPVQWITVFVEGQASSANGDRRKPYPESDGPIDLHQAFVSLGDAKQFPLVAKVGRQELSYGDERLVGAFDWNNNGRVFDAAKLRWQSSSFWVDAFSSRVVLPDDNHFDVPNDYDWFSGLYASTTQLLPKVTTELYLFSRNVGPGSTKEITTTTPAGGPSSRDIYTPGLRFKSLPGSFAGWDFEGEFAGQFGRFGVPGKPSLDQQAFAAHIGGGYTWAKAFGSPHLGLEYNYSSGDGNPNDGKHETFDNLFPTNHRFYGIMDFFSWQNMQNVRLATSLKPFKKLTLGLEYRAFWLADTQDYFYNVAGLPRKTGGYGLNASYNPYVGSEVDLVATCALTSYANVQAGLGHFFVGSYIESSLAGLGGASDANYLYLQGILNF